MNEAEQYVRTSRLKHIELVSEDIRGSYNLFTAIILQAVRDYYVEKYHIEVKAFFMSSKFKDLCCAVGLEYDFFMEKLGEADGKGKRISENGVRISTSSSCKVNDCG